MRRVREVLRLRHACGASERTIARSVGVARATVGEYLRRTSGIGITWPVPAEIDDAELERLLFTPSGFHRPPARIMPDWNHVHSELRRRGVTLLLLWEEYRAEQPDGYGYSRFCGLYIEWRRGVSATMRQTHVAGEKLFVDYAGDTVPVFDGATGEERRAHVFVAVLGASNYTYAEARWSEGLADWVGAHVNAFTFIGGVAKLLVCDNLRAGVTAACRYEPGINRTYQDMATHYGTAVMPARVRRPRDKAKVETAVLIVGRFILARVRNRRFLSLGELNEAIRELLGDLNARLMRRLGASRREFFETIDRPALLPLPTEPYAYAEWRRCRVAPDYHVEVHGHFYSVPSRLIREVVEARITDTTIEVFHAGRRIAAHPGRQAGPLDAGELGGAGLLVADAALRSDARHGAGSPKVFADDTTLPVLDPGRGRTKTGRLWCYAVDDRPWGGPGHPMAAYVYSDDRKNERPAGHLARFRGVLQVDGYNGFKALAGARADASVTLAFCWAHMRRHFYDHYVSDKSPLAAEVLMRVRELYAIEAEIRGHPAEHRRAMRQNRSRPIVEALHDWLHEQIKRVSAASDLAKVMRYAIRHWPGLVVFLDDGRVEMDTNVVERAIRPHTLTRKNALFAGSDGGAKHWALAMTLIQTAKLNGVDPMAWRTDVLERIVSGRTKAHEMSTLLPWTWAETHASPEAISIAA